jgi:SHS2 domain-containing protein
LGAIGLTAYEKERRGTDATDLIRCVEGAWGDTAFWNMMEIISGAEALPKEERSVEITAGEGEELLVNWLNEILFLFDSRGFLPAEFIIEQATENRIRARILGEPFDPERHPIDREIKAATYHQLRLEHGEKGWLARVYLDL